MRPSRISAIGCLFVITCSLLFKVGLLFVHPPAGEQQSHCGGNLRETRVSRDITSAAGGERLTAPLAGACRGRPSRRLSSGLHEQTQSSIRAASIARSGTLQGRITSPRADWMVPRRKDYSREDQLLGITLPRHVGLHVSKPARTLENVLAASHDGQRRGVVDLMTWRQSSSSCTHARHRDCFRFRRTSVASTCANVFCVVQFGNLVVTASARSKY